MTQDYKKNKEPITQTFPFFHNYFNLMRTKNI